jgi:uncharacterized protein (TIGR01244 family)
MHPTRSRIAAGLATLLLAAAAAWSQIPESVGPESIPNYRVIRPGLAVGGQPSPQALARLKEMGFRTVVNLRTEQEGGKDAEKAVRAAGLEYLWVPVTPATFSAADVDAVAKVLDDPGAGPVLLHCSSSNRSGAVWAALQARRGRSIEDAEADGRAAGLTSDGMVAAFRRVAGERHELRP